MTSGFKRLKVYQVAYSLAMEIFVLSGGFPKEERFALIDQIRRSSRSVCANLAEAYRKRRYPKHFISKISDSDCEASETIVWLDFALDCKYIEPKEHKTLVGKYVEVGKMLGGMMKYPERFE